MYVRVVVSLENNIREKKQQQQQIKQRKNSIANIKSAFILANKNNHNSIID